MIPASGVIPTCVLPCRAERNGGERRILHAAWVIRSIVEDDMIVQQNAHWYELVVQPQFRIPTTYPWSHIFPRILHCRV